MFIMPAAPNGCRVVFIVDSCAMRALNSAAEQMSNASLYEACMTFRSGCVMWLFVGV